MFDDKDTQPTPPAYTSEHLTFWERARMRLRGELGDAVYSSWFLRLELERVGADGVHLTVPTKFLKSWMQSHYFDRVRKHVVAEFGPIEQLTIEQRPQGRKSKFRDAAAEPEVIEAREPTRHFTPAPARKSPLEPAQGSTRRASGKPTRGGECDGFIGSPLDRRLCFATFLVGPSNQLAYAAACRAAEPRAPEVAPMFNPLYVHASVGLGKTHLLQAMARAAHENKLRVVYLTAEKFMTSFVSSLSAQTSIAFKESLRGIDMLIIDDVQFLKGSSIQQEFCHTLNALIDAGRQIIVAADRPPSELENLDERVLSRFQGGLCVDIGQLDEGLRVKLLEARIAAAQEKQTGFSVSPEVITYVARTVTTNGRELEGAVNRLLAHSALNGGPLTSHFNVSRAEILSSRRTANVVRPRQIAMYLAKTLTLRSLPEIGRRFGGRDHTTVLHAVRKIEELASKDRNLAEVIELLKRILSEA
jgi:chromosomal replication initiator protein